MRMRIPNLLRSRWLGYWTIKTCSHPHIEDMGEKWIFCEDVGCSGRRPGPAEEKGTKNV